MHTALFQEKILQYYEQNGRNLPWRTTSDPYAVLISEIMLQQTQVERVIPKYNAFLKVFPTLSAVAHASLADVLTLWQGLGYNRRAKYLFELAHVVKNTYDGIIPSSIDELRALPGIGYATACAIMVYAWNKHCVFVETNIRTVFLYHFFSNKTDVSDTEILELVTRTLYKKNPRIWYWALMDYGNMLKKEKKISNMGSKHFVKQSRFEGSDRQLRGKILTLLVKNKKVQSKHLHTIFHEDKNRIQLIVNALLTEQLITLDKDFLQLPHK